MMSFHRVLMRTGGSTNATTTAIFQRPRRKSCSVVVHCFSLAPQRNDELIGTRHQCHGKQVTVHLVGSLNPCTSSRHYWGSADSMIIIRTRSFSNNSAGNKKDDDKDATSTASKHDGSHFWTHWIHELQSPPNIITTTRILCTPLLSYWLITGHYKLAVAGCVLAAASDYLDGYLAKHHNMATVLGAFLDPMADKIFINVLAGSLWYISILPTPLVVLWLARDVALIYGAASYVRSHSDNAAHAYDPTVTPLKVNPTMLSKLNTALQFTTVGLGIVSPLGVVPPALLTGMW
jgi:phosphatidylglycerophosphate synthase